MLSPVEHYLKAKEGERKTKIEELEQKKREIENMFAQIKEAATLTFLIMYGITNPKLSYSSEDFEVAFKSVFQVHFFGFCSV